MMGGRLRLLTGTVQKKRRVHRGFATSSYRENVYICWKGRVPKVSTRCRKFISAGSRVSDDTLFNVPVLATDERPHVDPATKDKVLIGSAWMGKSMVDDEEEAAPQTDSESVGSASGGDAAETPSKKKKKASKVRRGRALTRTPTDANHVPMFSHPIHPSIIKELMHSLEGKWCIMGTPESGCGATGCLSPHISKPVIAICRNSAHAAAMKDLMEEHIVNSMLSLGNEWTAPTLAKQVNELVESESETLSASDSESSRSTQESKDQKDKKGNKDKKKKDKKEKGRKSEKTSKTKKKGKKENGGHS